MYDATVPISKVAAISLWVVVWACIAAAWATWALDLSHQLSTLFGFTGCATSAGAATLTIRCYATRVSRLVRLAGHLGPADRSHGQLRSVND